MKVRTHKYRIEDDDYVDTTHFDKKTKNLDIGFQRLKYINIKLYPQLSTVKSLFINHNKLSTLPDPGCMPNLTELDCSNNNLTHIPMYPKLIFLNASYNKITELPTYNKSNLQYLDCSFNQKFKPNIYLPKCEHLYINDSNINELDLSKFPNLKYLDCSNNNINKINTCNTLLELNIQRNHLIDLPSLPNLLFLMADDNSIKSILTYPKLTNMTVSYNQILFIDHQPELIKLNASHNKIDKIGDMQKIEMLDVSYNKLIDIQINKTTKYVSIQFNPLTKLDIAENNIIENMQVSLDTHLLIYLKYQKYFKSTSVIVSNDKLNEILQRLENDLNHTIIDYLRTKMHKITFQNRDEELIMVTYNLYKIMCPEKINTSFLKTIKTNEFDNLLDTISKIYYKSLVVTLFFKEN